MTRYYSTIFLFLIPFFAFCQKIKVLNQIKIDDYYSNRIIDAKKIGDKVYILGQFETKAIARTKSYSLTKIDFNGNILQTSKVDAKNVDGYTSFEIINDSIYLFRGFIYGKGIESKDCISCFNSNFEFKWSHDLETFPEGAMSTFIIKSHIYCFSLNVCYVLDFTGKLLKKEKLKLSNLPNFYVKSETDDFLAIGDEDSSGSSELKFVKLDKSLNKIKEYSFKVKCDCFPRIIEYSDEKLFCLFEAKGAVPKAMIFDIKGDVIDTLSLSIHPDTRNYYKDRLDYCDLKLQGNEKVIVGNIIENSRSLEHRTVLISLDSTNKMETKFFERCTPWTRSRLIKIGDRRFFLITEYMRNNVEENNIEVIEFEI